MKKNDDELAAAENDGIGIRTDGPSGVWGTLLERSFTDTQNDDENKIARHYGDVKYHNSRILEEVVNESPDTLDKDALRMALGPIILLRSEAGGHMAKNDLLLLRNSILTYVLKAKGRLA